jgi:hypothetical protein
VLDDLDAAVRRAAGPLVLVLLVERVLVGVFHSDIGLVRLARGEWVEMGLEVAAEHVLHVLVFVHLWRRV